MNFSPRNIQSGLREPAPGLPLDPVSRPPAVQGSPSANVQVDRMVFEGFGPLPSSGIRDGFAAVWETADASHFPSDASAIAEKFQQSLEVSLPPGASGYEIGRRLAGAIIKQAGKERV